MIPLDPPVAPTRRTLLLLLGLGATPAAAAPSFIEALFAPAAKLWPRWQAHDPGSRTVIDHAAWDGFLTRRLRRRVDGVMGVTYGAVTDADRTTLRGYLAEMARVPVLRLNRAEQFAFWVNLPQSRAKRIEIPRWP